MIETGWHKAESTIRPESIDDTSSSYYVLIRTNIIEETRKDETSGNTYIIYIYDEKFVLKEDWKVYEDVITNHQDIQTNSEDIISTQMGLAETYEETNNSITQLETALTEVYEMIIG